MSETTPNPLDIDRPRIDFLENPFSDNPNVDGIVGFASLPAEMYDAFEIEADREGITVEQFYYNVVANAFDRLAKGLPGDHKTDDH